MLVRSLRRHYDTSFREENELFDHTGPLYEHIVEVAADGTEPALKADPPSRERKPAKPAGRK
jgi:hypothetical protein